MNHAAIREELQREMQRLVGLRLWASGRAADVQWFQFGGRVSRTNRHGKVYDVGTYALHVQCAWRVLDRSSVVVGSADLDFDRDGEWLERRESDHRPSRLELTMKQLLDEDVRVASVDVSDLTSVRLQFSSAHRLELAPMSSLPIEQWRLLRNVEPTNHWIVSGTGVEKS